MFTPRYLNNALNSIHERALRLIYNDYELPFDRILEANKQKNIHQKNIELLTIEIYKFQAVLTPPIMSDLFVTREKKLAGDLKIWNLIPERLRALETLNKSKKEIKKMEV